MHDTAMNIAQNASYRFLRKVRNIQQGTKSAERKYISFVNCTLLRGGKKINIVLLLWVLQDTFNVYLNVSWFWKCVRPCRKYLFLLINFYQLMNMDLVSKDRIFEKYQTRSTTSLQLHCNLILPDRAKLCRVKFSSG